MHLPEDAEAEKQVLQAKLRIMAALPPGQCWMWKSPATRNRTRDHLIAASFYSQMLYQLSYSRLVCERSWLVAAFIQKIPTDSSNSTFCLAELMFPASLWPLCLLVGGRPSRRKRNG